MMRLAKPSHAATLEGDGHEVLAVTHGALMLALVAGLLFATPAARADDGLPHKQQTLDGVRADRARVQPTASQFAAPNEPDVSPSSARVIDQLYQQLIGAKPTTSFGVNGAGECSRCRRSTGGADALH